MGPLGSADFVPPGKSLDLLDEKLTLAQPPDQPMLLINKYQLQLVNLRISSTKEISHRRQRALKEWINAKFMGKRTQPFANSNVRGKYPESAMRQAPKKVISWTKLSDFH